MARKKSPATEMNVAEKQELPLAQRLNELITDVNKLKEALGVSAQAINQYKIGTSRPSLENLCKIADFYGVTTDYLLGRTGTKSINPTVQAAAEYTGLTEKTIDALRGTSRIFALLNDDVSPNASSESIDYHYKSNPADLFFSSPAFRECVVAFHKYGAFALLLEDTQKMFLAVLKENKLVPEDKATITATEVFEIANNQEDDKDITGIIKFASHLLQLEGDIKFHRFCLVNSLEKVADFYKADVMRKERQRKEAH